MKEKLIKIFGLRFIKSTKWNDVYQNDTHVFIWNRATSIWKIKPQ